MRVSTPHGLTYFLPSELYYHPSLFAVSGFTPVITDFKAFLLSFWQRFPVFKTGRIEDVTGH